MKSILEIASSVTKLKRQGRCYVGLCPFHKEETPSFTVDPGKGEFHCFGCGAKGGAARLEEMIEGLKK